MNKYIIGIFTFILAFTACSGKRIELGGIENRSQLDSIMALLPADSIQVDSLAYRQLYIKLNGDFSLFGTPINSVVFKLKKEELSEMEANYISSGVLSLLNNIEADNGLGQYESSAFHWKIGRRNIILEPRNMNSWGWGRIEPIHLHDSLGFNYMVTYDRNVDNKITRLYKDVPSNEKFSLYSLSESFYTGLKTRMYINGVELDPDLDMEYINTILPQKEGNMLTVEIIPPYDRIREIDKRVKELTSGGEQTIVLKRKIDGKDKKERIKEFVLATDIDKHGTTQHFMFDALDLPYTLDYVNGVNLQSVDNLKEKIYKYYQDYKNALETNNTGKVMDLIYPVIKNDAIALNYNKSDSRAAWEDIEGMIENNEGVELLPIDDLEIEFACKGLLARLVPKVKGEDGAAFSMVLYRGDGALMDIAYYVYIDKSNNINFGLE